MKPSVTYVFIGGITAAALGYGASVAEDQQRRWLEQVTPLAHMPLVPGHNWDVALYSGLIGALLGLVIGYVVPPHRVIIRALPHDNG